MTASSAERAPRAGDYVTPVVILLASLAIFAYTVNLSSPWESDQSAKAAQILEIADANDYLLSDSLTRCYFLKLYSLYYSVSGLVYDIVGGPIFRFMNLSSILAGVLLVLSTAYTVRNALGAHPLWSAAVLLSMPLVVVSSTYGNEAIWALAMLALALFLATCRIPSLYYSSGVAMACAIFCRADMVFAGPFWIAWAAIFGPVDEPRVPLVRRLLWLAIAFCAASGLLWILLVREIPEPPLAFEFNTNFMLMAAFLSYPFNPSIVIIAAIGWLALWKLHARYAMVHLLLLLPLAFYFRNLSSPKYVILFILFYGIPAALLLSRGAWYVRACGVAAILFWWVVGLSNFGVFGPGQAALWYVPSADGPIPTGGYVKFYERAREGFYQAKQVERIELTRQLAAATSLIAADVRVLGQYDEISRPYVRYLRRHEGADIDPLFPAQAKEGDNKFVMVRTGYIGLARFAPKWVETVRGYLERGQVRAMPGSAAEAKPFPD
ncbi:MAG TPA: hypothetical protein VHK01_12660, partial [Lacipirellulaceae bacterium]|nr:hypothetical protein [Lacipirellulaceae bacterium]